VSIRTLIADDEALARRRLVTLLGQHPDFEVAGECEDGTAVAAIVERFHPHLLFLDIEMPGMSGLAAARLSYAPRPVIVFVTAHEEFAVEAFDLDAADYLLKPFDAERFARTLLRVRAELRHGDDGSARVLRVGDLEMDVPARRVRSGVQEVSLRRIELEVLLRLLQRAGEVITRRELFTDVWGYKDDVVSRTLDTHVFELRRKLGRVPGQGGYIETIARVGYRLTCGDS